MTECDCGAVRFRWDGGSHTCPEVGQRIQNQSGNFLFSGEPPLTEESIWWWLG